MPGKANLAIYQGDDYAGVVTVSNGSGTPDLTGYTAKAQIRSGPADSNPEVITEIQTAVALNLITLSIPASETAGLAGHFVWDLQVTSPGGETTTLLAGVAVATPEVTR